MEVDFQVLRPDIETMMQGRPCLARLMMVLVLAFTVSCGGGGGGSRTCSMAGNCGGDLTGDWRVTASCVRTGGTAGVMACPNATVSGTVDITGNASYNADLTYTATLIMSGPQTVDVPASCLTQSGLTVNCAQLTELLGLMPSLTPLGLKCSSASGGGCTCTATLKALTVTGGGSYATSGGMLTIMPNGGTPQSNDYCVKGSSVLDVTPPSSITPLPGLTLNGDLTFMRQ